MASQLEELEFSVDTQASGLNHGAILLSRSMVQSTCDNDYFLAGIMHGISQDSHLDLSLDFATETAIASQAPSTRGDLTFGCAIGEKL